jgi:hypothetical protein
MPPAIKAPRAEILPAQRANPHMPIAEFPNASRLTLALHSLVASARLAVVFQILEIAAHLRFQEGQHSVGVVGWHRAQIRRDNYVQHLFHGLRGNTVIQ